MAIKSCALISLDGCHLEIEGRRKGVTVVELVVVLGIIAVLIGILLPATLRAREAARETVCRNNIKNINLALSQYSEVAGVPPANPIDRVGGWAIKALPFLDQGNLEQAIPDGIPLLQLEPQYHAPPRIMQCPSQQDERSSSQGSVVASHYVLISNPLGKRKSYALAESPLTLDLPWASSPELASLDEIGDDGPHNGGYFFANGFGHEVGYHHPVSK